MKYFAPLFFLLSAFAGFSQDTKKALALYNDGVLLYNKQLYHAADSLSSLSLGIRADKDTYFSRALARGKMSMRQGYCEDLMQSAIHGENKAVKIFLKSCGKIDTSRTKFYVSGVAHGILSKNIAFHLPDSGKQVFTQKYAGHESTSPFKACPPLPNPKDSADASFPGGVGEMAKFIQTELYFPKEFLFRGKRQVFLKFAIYEDGSLQDITVIKGSEECPPCDVEATRVVALMPYWVPAYKNGQAVKSYFNLPISFTVQ